MLSTLPSGIGNGQYLEVIYPAVCGKHNPSMEREEHWRRRLFELKEALQATQASMAAAAGIEPSYMSRLLYPPGKAGRKNLGLETLRAFLKAYGLAADWFDLPLGAALPHLGPQTALEMSDPTPARSSRVIPLGNGTSWPFHTVTPSRILDLKRALGTKTAAEAMRDIDSLLDAAVSKWERIAAEKKKRKR